MGAEIYSDPPGNKCLLRAGRYEDRIRAWWSRTWIEKSLEEQWKALLQRRAWTARQPAWPYGEHGEPGQPHWPQEGGRTFFQVQWRAAERFQAVTTGSDGYSKEITFVCGGLVAQSCPTLCDPMDCGPPGSSVYGDSPECWSGLPCPPPGDFLNPGIEPRSPALQADSLPSEPPVKPMNTGVGSLSLLQGFDSDLGIELGSPALQTDSLPAELSGKAEITFIKTNAIFTPPMPCCA